MKKNFFVALALLATVITNAQQSSVASGGDAAGRKGSASYTLGQVAYSTPVGKSGSAAQGIQQPYEVSEIMIKNSLPESQLRFTTYPNPTTDIITLEIKNYNQENLSYELISINGQLLETNKITQNNTSIIMKRLAQGTYMLKITDNQLPVKTFKIIKN